MSKENIEIVRQEIALGDAAGRRPEERIALRAPRVLAAIAGSVQRLPLRSRVRQAFLRRAVQLGFGAANRRDYAASFLLYHPDIELVVPAELTALGLRPRYRGLAERVQFQRDWDAEWGDFQFRPQELLTFGDRLMVVGHIRGSGLSSGAGFDSEWAIVIRTERGRVIREWFWFDHAAAFEFAGLARPRG